MLDVLIPIHECFLPEHAEGKTLFEVLQEASHAAKEGVDFTKTIAARRGAQASSASAVSAMRTQAL